MAALMAIKLFNICKFILIQLFALYRAELYLFLHIIYFC
jgi:hypothetical protein